MNYWLLAILIVVSYFIGNINFARILSRKRNIDITKQGSGNPGTTNMLRTFGMKMGWITLGLDVLKGVIPSLMGLLVFGIHTTEGTIALFSCGLAAMIGHIFPVIYKFKGGKGAATMLGVYLVAQPIPALILFVVAYLIVWLSKYLSLGSMTIITVMTLYQNLTMPEPNLVISILTYVMFLIIWFAFRPNIKAFLAGTERISNIRRTFKKDRKLQQKIDKQAEKKAEKVEIKFEKEEEKASIEEATAEIKADIKESKANIKDVRITTKENAKEIKKNNKADMKEVKADIKAEIKGAKTVAKEDIKQEKANIKQAHKQIKEIKKRKTKKKNKSKNKKKSRS